MKLKKNGEKWGCLWDSKKKESGWVHPFLGELKDE